MGNRMNKNAYFASIAICFYIIIFKNIIDKTWSPKAKILERIQF